MPLLGTLPGDTHLLHFHDIRGMNHKPQKLLEATFKQGILDAYEKLVFSTFILVFSSRKWVEDIHKILFLASSFFQSWPCCTTSAFSTLFSLFSPFLLPKALGAATHPHAGPVTKCKMWSIPMGSNKVTLREMDGWFWLSVQPWGYLAVFREWGHWGQLWRLL